MSLKQLPLLTDDELDVLYAAVAEHLGTVKGSLDVAQSNEVKAALTKRWHILNSLRTAVGETRANPVGGLDD